MRQFDQKSRIGWVILNNQQDGIVGLKVSAVVQDLRLRALRRGNAPHWSSQRYNWLRCWGTGIFQRQVERKDAASSGGALQLNFAAEECCQLTADREAQTGPAVFPASARIGLLKRLENTLLLLGQDTYSGVGDLEGYDRTRVIQDRVAGAPAVARRRNCEAHAACFSEFEGI